MRKLVFVYSMLFLYMCLACSDNENLEPSGFDKDWFVIENDPTDPLKSLVYDIYVNKKIAVFITIRSEEACGEWIRTEIP